MYYPDMAKHKNEEDTYYIGWLDNKHEFPRGDVPKEFLDRLWIFCLNKLFQTKGLHLCEFCGMEMGVVSIHKGDSTFFLGFAEYGLLIRMEMYMQHLISSITIYLHISIFPPQDLLML